MMAATLAKIDDVLGGEQDRHSREEDDEPLEPMTSGERATQSAFLMVSPKRRARRWWDLLGLLMTMITVILLPLQFAFEYEPRAHTQCPAHHYRQCSVSTHHLALCAPQV